ncbi:hypothetical protein ACFVGM_08900 [Kitasatospora purpeofusca]|uniref:hypothetical protein n=1 Tax=Kitasatospora purpeofusca TaxID=67352 RepID=UPI0036CAFEC2
MFSRLDWKRGRWNVNAETSAIHRGLRGWQRTAGDSIVYWRFDFAGSQVDDVYDEGAGGGKAYYGPMTVPVLHVDHREAPNAQPRDSGLYVVDQLYVTASFDQLERAGLSYLDLQHGSVQRDRVAYDNALYDVTHADVRGQVRRRDVIVSLVCTQVMNDELVNDPVFADYLRGVGQNPAG